MPAMIWGFSHEKTIDFIETRRLAQQSALRMRDVTGQVYTNLTEWGGGGADSPCFGSGFPRGF